MQTKVFGPLGMTQTTFDFSKELSGNVASLHDNNIDGETKLARMDINYSVVPPRPAGGMWTSAHDLSRYLQMELARGALPDGNRLVSQLSGHASSMRRALVAAASSRRNGGYTCAKRIDALLLRATGYIALLAQPNWRELAW